jgi:hypothetical protein
MTKADIVAKISEKLGLEKVMYKHSRDYEWS